MDPELKSLLEENLRVAKDTNEMLRKMQQFSRWSLAGKVVLYALVFIIPLFFLSTYLGPIEALMNPATGPSGQGTNYTQNLENLINQYQGQ